MPVDAQKFAVTILVVSWNSLRDVRRCLRSIREMKFRDISVLVVDNGSVDGTPARVREEFPEVVVRVNARNEGLPAAINTGLGLASGEFVMLLDVDTEVCPDTVGTLVEFMRARPEIAVCAPRIHAPDGSIEQSARNLPSPMNGLFGRQSVLTRWFPNNPFSRRYLAPQNLDRSQPFQVEQVSAACMFMRRSAIADAGTWDEHYRCYWVDSDWCAKLKSLGKIIYCVPTKYIVHHENNKAGKKKAPWRIWHFHAAAYRLYRKHYTFGALDPRAMLAGAALMTRALLMYVLNAMKSQT